jgi:phage terminase small subunit
MRGKSTNIMGTKQLTPKERFFVVEYLKDFNATKAAIRAGYSGRTARSIGSENLTKPDICEALKESYNAIAKREEKALMDAYEVELRLDAIIRFNLKDYIDDSGVIKPMHELSRESAACISEFTIIETPLGIQRRLKFFNKLDAIKAKMQRLGLLKEHIDHKVAVETHEERLKRLKGGS